MLVKESTVSHSSPATLARRRVVNTCAWRAIDLAVSAKVSPLMLTPCLEKLVSIPKISLQGNDALCLQLSWALSVL